MSYKSLKRVLGETSLERKCRFLFGGCLLLLITGSFWWYGTNTEKLLYKQNRTEGRLLVATAIGLLHLEKLEPSEDFRDLMEHTNSNIWDKDYKYRILRPHYKTPEETPADDFERQLLERLMNAVPPPPDEPPAGNSTSATDIGETAAEVQAGIAGGEDSVEFAERRPTGKQQYQYYQAIRATTSLCVNCHRGVDLNPQLAENDLLAIVQVSIPDGPTQADLAWNRALLLSTAIITVFLAMLAAYVIVRYVIVKPLKHLRDVSDSISRGEVNERADIHTGDEFEELGVAFNRMLTHQTAAQEALRNANSSLDNKVDELAQVNLQLFAMNRMKSDFLATMSHELRTPLNSIIGFSDVLGSIRSLDDKQRRYVLNIQKSGKMLLDMINDILDLAKIESGKMEVRLTAFRIEQVVVTQCDLARPLTEKKNIDLATVIEPHVADLYQDQGKLHQILNNLLSNAIKFTPEGGRIVVSARRNDAGQLELVVTDTGVGIAEADQANIFEKFRQGESVLPSGDALAREYSGTGLGLSIVNELCKLLGGEISLTSELGKGSTFTVRLPWVLTREDRIDASLTDSFPAPTNEWGSSPRVAAPGT
jgi:signal transduction histidine kinase